MAQDATNTPTSLGIPKINGNVDPPTPNGINAMMDSIDTLLIARISKPASPNTNDSLVWNGSSWTNSKVTSAMILDGTIVDGDVSPGTLTNTSISGSAAIGVTKLAAGAAGQLLASQGGTNTWKNIFNNFGFAALATNFGPSTSAYGDVTGLSVTKTVSGNASYIAVFLGNAFIQNIGNVGSSGVSGAVDTYIDLDGTDTSASLGISSIGTVQADGGVAYTFSDLGGWSTPLTCFAMGTLSSGSHTWKVRAKASLATNCTAIIVSDASTLVTGARSSNHAGLFVAVFDV